MEAKRGPRVVLVHDWLTGMRGGEKCLEGMCRRLPRARPAAEDDEVEVPAAGPELVSLEEVGAVEEEAGAADDVSTLTDEGGAEEDTFLEEEEEGGDVTDLIDGDIEPDEES